MHVKPYLTERRYTQNNRAQIAGASMRAILVGGLLAALAPTLALAATKVELGDGVSVVFPAAPAKSHMTNDPPPPGSKDGTGFNQAIGSADMWMLRVGGATFHATVMSPRQAPGVATGKCNGPPMPVAPGTIGPCDSPAQSVANPPERRRVLEDGTLFVTRTVKVNGHVYGVTYTRMGETNRAKMDPKHETPPDSAGEAFVDSFKVAARPAG